MRRTQRLGVGHLDRFLGAGGVEVPARTMLLEQEAGVLSAV